MTTQESDRTTAFTLRMDCSKVGLLLLLFLYFVACSSDNGTPDAGAGSPPDASLAAETGSTSQPTATPPTGTIHGVAHFTGVPPKAVRPKKLEEVAECPQDLRLFPARVRDGKLQGVVVRLAGEVPFVRERAGGNHPVLGLRGCVFEPAVQGALRRDADDPFAGIDIRLERPPLHVVLSRTVEYHGVDVSDPERRIPLPVTGVWWFYCAVHPWERAYALVTPHPYFAVTGEDGQFTIPDIPTGTYEVEGWHPQYGWKRRPNIEVRAGQTTEADLSYADSDPMPPESQR